MKKKRIIKLSSVFPWLAALTLSAGCLGPASIYSLRDLDTYLDETLTDEDRELCGVPYVINDEIAEYARRVTRYQRSDYDKAVSLVDHIVDQTKLNISYSNDATKTAEAVFYEGQANCLSYTSLFVGMARSTGMDAVFVDVTAVQSLSDEGEVMVHNGHICAGVFHSNSFVLIDFAPDPTRKYTNYRVIDDVEATANFYNNLGYERSKHYTKADFDAGLDEDIRYYRAALKLKPDFAKAINNLGVAYARRNEVEKARAMYQKAVDYQRNFAAAYGNLATLYYRNNEYGKAIAAYKQAIKFTNNDYYYFHQLGMNYLALHNYPEAEKSFRRALKRKPSYYDALHGLAIALTFQNHRSEAEALMAQAALLKEQDAAP
ncbi:tetratricopeptide repeat protein [bacterium]|nr:tetratricopeptide repeat protein [candidate division CSSED10-310 bacterium]